MTAGRGTLFLVVGPSGAGKDSLIAAARARLDDRSRFLFPRRVVTRPADAGGEDHEAATPAAFAERRAAGGFCLDWKAHGLCYGLPTSCADALADGWHVVANVSRTVIDDARIRFTPVRVVSVVVAEAELARRLRARGRESADDVAGRLIRAQAFSVSGPDVVTIDNSGPLDAAAARFLAALGE